MEHGQPVDASVVRSWLELPSCYFNSSEVDQDGTRIMISVFD